MRIIISISERGMTGEPEAGVTPNMTGLRNGRRQSTREEWKQNKAQEKS
jgi:hypothetical protein